jgi:anti-sigma B factor antagonist
VIFQGGFQAAILPDGSLLLRGELDMANAQDLRDFAAYAVDGTREVVFDLTDLTYLDSSGIKAIVRLAESVCPQGLVLRSPRDNVRRVLDIVQIEQVAGIRVELPDDPNAGNPLPQVTSREPAERFDKMSF